MQLTLVDNKHVTARRRLDEQERIVDALRRAVGGAQFRLRYDLSIVTYRTTGLHRRTKSELNEKFPDLSEWTEVIQSLPSDVQQLEDMASAKRYQAATLTCNNPDVMTSYEQFQTQLTSLEAQLEASKAEFEQAKIQVDQAKVGYSNCVCDLFFCVSREHGCKD